MVRQSIGRGLRKHAEKSELIIVDITDDFSYEYNGKTIFENFMLRHLKARLGIYKELKLPYSIKSVDL